MHEKRGEMESEHSLRGGETVATRKGEGRKEIDQKGKEKSSVIVMCHTWENGDGKGWFKLS